MGNLNRFEITLNNPKGLCFAGHYIHGQVTVELNKAMKMRGIRAKFSGRSRVSWSEGSEDGGYFEVEVYLDHELVIFGKASGGDGDNPTLPAGRHTFPFHYHLPEHIPSSFKGLHGEVRYWITCTVDKPWRFDHTTKTDFTVLSILDLNTEPEALIGIRTDDEKSVCCCCCKSGPISCVFQLDRCGYVPGEVIPIKAEIINHSNRRIFKTSAELHMEATFNSGRNSITTNNKVVERARGEILPGHSDNWTGQRLLIPQTPPSYLSGCRLIDIRYYVQLSVHISGPSFKLRVPIDVIIGTIPISHPRGVRPPSRAPELQSSRAPYSVQLYEEASLIQGYNSPIMPRPSFAKSGFGTVDIRDEDDSKYMKGNMNYTLM